MNQKKVNITKMLGAHKRVMLLGVLITLMNTGLGLINPWVMKIMVDEAIPKNQLNLLVVCVGAVVAIPLIMTLISSVEQYVRGDMSAEMIDQLRYQLLTKLTRLSPKTLYQYKQGDLANRITRTCGSVESYFRNSLLPSASDVLRLLGITFFIFTLNVKLALASLLLIPVVLWVSYLLIRSYKDTSEKLSQLKKEYDTFATELVGGLKTVQMFNQEEYEIDYGKSLNEKYRLLGRSVQKQRTFFRNIFWTLNDSLSLGILFAIGIWLIRDHQLTLGSLIAFTVYIPQLYSSASRIQDLYFDTAEVKPELARLQEIMNLPEENLDHPDSIPLEKACGQIEFRNISFQYQVDRANLQNISFTIQPGEFIGIVGPTGGGKTTILDLLMRFYSPGNGEILLDGKNLQQYRLSDLRNHISMVPQDIFLWNRTIKENLTYVAPNCTDNQLTEVTHIAQIQNFIETLPEGLNSLVGDRGVRLSGGEKQRLAIARTLLRKPHILLLDEPTSALDAHTESLLQTYLEQIYKDKTVIVVAHRLATIRRADRIFVIADGNIAETGTHDQLMREQGIYHRLFTEQMQGVGAVS